MYRVAGACLLVVTLLADALVDVDFIGVLGFATHVHPEPQHNASIRFMVEVQPGWVHDMADECTRYCVPLDCEARCEGLYHTYRFLQTNSRHRIHRDQLYH